MLNNLEYYDSKELGDYDDICDLIEKVSGSIHQATRIKKYAHDLKKVPDLD